VFNNELYFVNNINIDKLNKAEAIRNCKSKENKQNNGQKRQSEAVNRRRTDKTMAKRGNQKL
jgi:hypothetical protein